MFTAPDPPSNTMVLPTDTNTTVISWTAPILGVQTCKGKEQFTYTVTVSHSNGSLVIHVTIKNITVDIHFCTVNSVTIVALNSIGSGKPAKWTDQDRSLENIQCMLIMHAHLCMCNGCGWVWVDGLWWVVVYMRTLCTSAGIRMDT